MERVRLKNGTEEAAVLVVTIRNSLKRLLEGPFGLRGVFAVYDLGKLAKDPRHALYSNEVFDLLKKFSLLDGTFENPTMHDSTRNIVVCMVEFALGGEPCLVDPRAAAD